MLKRLKRQLLKTGLDRLALLYLGLLLIWLSLRLIWFDQFWWLGLLNTFAFWWMLPLVLVMPWVLWRRQWWRLAACALPLVLVLHWYGPLFLPSFAAPAVAAPSAATVKVMSFNILINNRNYDAIADAIRQEDPDIVGFQELRPEHIAELQTRLGAVYPYGMFSPEHNPFNNGVNRVGVISRIPIQQQDKLPPPLAERGIQVKFEIEDKPLALWVTHFSPSNLYVFPLSQWASLWQQSHGQRMEQAQQVASAAEMDTPLVMLCDCNMSPTTAPYEVLGQSLTDSFRRVGWGLGPTRVIRRRWPVLRVDYVWHNQGVRPVEAHVGTDGASDHLPVVATLRLETIPGQKQ